MATGTGSYSAPLLQSGLPAGDEDASKFIREAMRAYPELYVARYVIPGEGATEEIVLPVLAKAMDFPIDRSFIVVVPLWGVTSTTCGGG